MVDLTSTCLPDSFKTDAYFSPGLACPSGYVSACHDATGVGSITTVTCCPTLKDPDVTLGCVTTSTLSGSWSTLYCTWIAPESPGTMLPLTSVVKGVTTTNNVKFTSPGGLNAFGIRMVYEASDLSTKTTGKTSSSSSSSASQSSGGTSTSNPPQNTDTGDSGGLSTGAKVAIGVVIPLVALAALLGAFFWWRRRKHSYQSPPQVEDKPPTQHQAELHGTHINELMAHPHEPVELPGSNPIEQPTPGKSSNTARWA